MLGRCRLKLINYRDVVALDAEEGSRGVKVRWLITENDGAENFAMRLFSVECGGFTPLHSHDWEHEVFILDGRGRVSIGEEEEVFKEGDVIFIPGNVKHQFKNNSEEEVEFLCLIPYL